MFKVKTNMNSINDIINDKAGDLFPVENNQPASLASDITNNDQPSTTNEQPTLNNLQTELDLEKLKAIAYSLKDQIDGLIRALNGEQVKNHKITNQDSEILNTGEKIVEGVFNGEKMIGADGNEYAVPPNYASKSKLVEGDLMKLTITNRGSFIFKQIGPIERKRLVGEIVCSIENQWSALANGKTFKLLTASVTFYKGKAGDEVVVLVPQSEDSAWGAVDNIIHSTK